MFDHFFSGTRNSKRRNNDYGYGASPDPCAPPVLVDKASPHECPKCKGLTLFQIRVEVSDADADSHAQLRLLRGKGKVQGTYAGCAACHYSSPAMYYRSMNKQESEVSDE